MQFSIDTLKTILVLLFASQLGACAVMSKSDCLNADWQQEGYDVGISGEPDISSAFNKREKRCAKYQTGADWTAFERGYSDGVDQYCAVSNALKLGVRGASRAVGTCPESEYFGFYSAFTAGYRLYQLNEVVRQADYQLSQVQSKLYNYQRERDNLRHRLNSNELSEEERRYAVERYRRAGRQISYLRLDSRIFENRLYESERAADKYTRYLKAQFNDDAYLEYKD